jgi:hypothetical protein
MLQDWTDRELIHERFHWGSGSNALLIEVISELERRGYVVFDGEGVPRSEENMLGQEGLRRRKEHREGSCGLQTCSTELL